MCHQYFIQVIRVMLSLFGTQRPLRNGPQTVSTTHTERKSLHRLDVYREVTVAIMNNCNLELEREELMHQVHETNYQIIKFPPVKIKQRKTICVSETDLAFVN